MDIFSPGTLSTSSSQTSIDAPLNALSKNISSMQQALADLASGSKLNSAADNASDYAISEGMQGQISGLNQANDNAQNGVSLIQTAAGGLDQTLGILQRMRELAVEAPNGTNTTADDTALNDEFQQLGSEIDQIASTTQFNGMNLLSGRFAANGITLQIGANSGQTVTFAIKSAALSGLGLTAINISGAGAASSAITAIDTAISGVSEASSSLGAAQHRLQYISDNLTSTAQNNAAANAQIVDANMSQEIADYTHSNILVQATTSVLAQANQHAQSVLKFLL